MSSSVIVGSEDEDLIGGNYPLVIESEIGRMLVVKDHEGQIGVEFCHTKAAIAPSKLPALHVRTDRAIQMVSKTARSKHRLNDVESLWPGGTVVANSITVYHSVGSP